MSWRDDPAASAAGQVVESVLVFNRRPAAERVRSLDASGVSGDRHLL